MDQELALDILKAGHNVLLTGSAGTGKTYVLHQFIEHLRKHQVRHAITASTGLAATHLNGVTIHSWAKIGIKDWLPQTFAQKLAAKDKDRIKDTDVLIIDEISMLHDFRLDMVDEALRRVRKSERPFGGLQIVLCGDFFQLPPVNGRGDARSGGFVVNSKAWENANFQICYLEKSYRHSDASFNEILNAIRGNDVRRRHAEALLERVNAELPTHIEPTQLYVTNVDSDLINRRELTALDTESHRYTAVTSGKKQFVESLVKSCLAEEVLELKTGARVMFVRNNPNKGYINGTLGEVTGFAAKESTASGDKELYPVVRTLQGRTILAERETWELAEDDDTPPKAKLAQIPLRLAWAITVHKSQGMTLDAASVDLGRAFVEGMGYVALSRVRSLEHLSLKGINKMALRVAPEALEIDQQLKSRSYAAFEQREELVAAKPPYILHEPLTPKQRSKASAISSILDNLGKAGTEAGDGKLGGNAKGPKGGPNGGAPLDQLRKMYAKAYAPWSDEEDSQLLARYNQGMKTKQIALMHARQPGAVRARLKKLLEPS